MQRVVSQQRRRWGALLLGALSATLSWQLLRPVQLPSLERPSWVRVAALPLPEPVEPAPQREGLFEVAVEPDSAPLKLPGDMRCGQVEMGNNIEASVGRYAVVGPRDNPDLHLSRPVEGRGYPTAPGATWVVGPQPEIPQGSAGPTTPFGRDTALGTDETSAQGRMWGEDPNGQFGEYGFGLAGVEGSVVKRFDVAPLPANHTAELRVVHTGLQVTGARKASEVGRAMAAHFAEFKACAQATGLGDSATKQLRVALDFDVNEAGQAVPAGASAAAGTLQQCLDQNVSRVAFAAGASAVTHVVYPLHLAAPDRALKNSGVASPVVREPCACGG